MKVHGFGIFRSISVLVAFMGFMVSACPLHAGPLDTTRPYVLSAASCDTGHADSVGLEDEICVTVVNSGELIDETRRTGKNIILFLSRMPLKEVYPESYNINRDKDELHFFIRHTTDPIALWDYFIASRKAGQFFTRKVSVSVGLEDQAPIPTLVDNAKSFTLVLVNKAWFTASIVIIGALLILFLFLAAKSNMLRNVGPNPDIGQKAYSLALVQMAIWFFVIMTSWLLLYVVKHSFNTISDTLVLLMGISAGTGIGGVAIDTNRSKPAQQSQGFLKDILSDDYGISFHRFQIFAWTIVLVAVFIRQVTAYMTMPEFDSSLLVLMGISSGTYLGVKVTEKTGKKTGMKKAAPSASTLAKRLSEPAS